jgi:uncharacterized protein (DUF924 family)
MDFENLLTFWFGSGTLSDPRYVGERVQMWFGKNEKVDEQMRTRFGPWLDACAAGELASWRESVRGRLATVLLLDQVPRNSFRGQRRAFAYDPEALACTRAALSQGDDKVLHPVECIFLLLPFEHSENLKDQEESLRRFSELAERTPPALRQIADGTLDYARRHHEIITRFGRFPHRNSILGRTSTLEEVEFLKQPGSGF